MLKFLNKWVRVFHRWIALPTLIIIPVAVVTKFTVPGDHLPPQIEQFQSVLMLLLALSGAYLYLVPYLAKWQRNRRKQRQTHRVGSPAKTIRSTT